MAGEYTLRTDDSPNPRSMVFLLASGKPAFTIWSDGRVEVGSEVTADEAGKRVFEVIAQMWANAFRPAVLKEREACARVADKHAEHASKVDNHNGWLREDMAEMIAAAIRARGKE